MRPVWYASTASTPSTDFKLRLLDEKLPFSHAETGGWSSGSLSKVCALLWPTAHCTPDILTKWVMENCRDPRPSNEDEEELSRETGLTKRQVRTWVANVRKRNMQATINREKKPHHFLGKLTAYPLFFFDHF